MSSSLVQDKSSVCSHDALAALVYLLKLTITDYRDLVSQGFLNMAKARRSMGRNSVSVLDTREEYSAEVTIAM